MQNGSSILPDTEFSWDWDRDGEYPFGYTFYLGTDNPPTNIMNGVDVGYALSYSPAQPLELNTTYYWQVVSYNSMGDATECPVRTFTSFSTNSFAGGDGTEADPWQVSTAEHLYLVRQYLGSAHANKHFIQTAPIELGQVPWNYGKGWSPIGVYNIPFHGTYNGNGNTINGLTISSGPSHSGLFGYMNGRVKNLALTNASVQAGNETGIIAGKVVNGWIENCQASGTVEAAKSGLICGVLGGGGIISCTAAGEVNGAGANGICGEINTLADLVNTHYKRSAVLLNNSDVLTLGVLPDAIYDDWLTNGKSLDIEDYLSPVRDGQYQVGNQADLYALLAFGLDPQYSYLLTSNISLDPGFYLPGMASGFDGGGFTINNLLLNQNNANLAFFGRLEGTGVSNLNLTNVEVHGSDSVGSLAGLVDANISNCTASGSIHSGNTAGGFVAVLRSGNITNCISSVHVNGTNAHGFVASLPNPAQVSNSFYNIDSVLINNNHSVTYRGLYNDLYNNWIAGNKSLNVNSWFSCIAGVYQVNNLDRIKKMLGFADLNLNFKITANIELSSEGWHYLPYFKGSIDGNNKVISVGDNAYVNWIGILGSDSSISKLGVLNLNGLVNVNYGTISRCFILEQGYLAFYNYGTVENCFNEGWALVSRNDGILRNCYSVHKGLGGGLTEYQEYGQIISSYYNSDLAVYSQYGQPKTTQQMLLSSTYEGWDFSNVWQSNNGYPRLRTQPSMASAIPLPALTDDTILELNYPALIHWNINTSDVTKLPYGFRLYIGTDYNANNVINNRDLGWMLHIDPYSIPQLQLNQTYFWKIVPYNQLGDAQNCPVWQFVLRTNPDPVLATNPVPADYATNVSINLGNLSWRYEHDNLYSPPVGFRVYIHYDRPDYRSFVWVPYVLDQVNYSLPINTALLFGVNYYWMVVPTTEDESRAALSMDELLAMHSESRAKVQPADLRSVPDRNSQAGKEIQQSSSGDTEPKGDALGSFSWRFTTEDDPYPGFVLLPEGVITPRQTDLSNLQIEVSDDLYIDPRIDKTHGSLPTLLNYAALTDSSYTVLGFSRGPLVPTTVDSIKISLPPGKWYGRLHYAASWHLAEPVCLEVSVEDSTGTMIFTAVNFTAHSEAVCIISKDIDPTTMDLVDVEANEPVEIELPAGQVTIVATEDVIINPNVPISHPVIIELPNYANFTEYIVFSISSAAVDLGELRITLGEGYWFGRIYFNGSWNISVPPAILVLAGETGELVFQNIEFPAKEDVLVLITKDVDPTLSVQLSSFVAVLTAEMNVHLKWVAESELDHAGYNIHRNYEEQLGTAIKINTELISEGTQQGTQISYNYLDTQIENNTLLYYWLESRSLGGISAYHGPISVTIGDPQDPDAPQIPLRTELFNAYPNPFNPKTNIRYSLNKADKVKIEIYNLRGQRVKTFETDHAKPGYYNVIWDGRDNRGQLVGSGLYYYMMSCDEFSQSKKMLMMK